MRDRFLQFASGRMWNKHRPRRRGLKARSNASLSLTNVRELLPQPLWRCFLIGFARKLIYYVYSRLLTHEENSLNKV